MNVGEICQGQNSVYYFALLARPAKKLGCYTWKSVGTLDKIQHSTRSYNKNWYLFFSLFISEGSWQLGWHKRLRLLILLRVTALGKLLSKT